MFSALLGLAGAGIGAFASMNSANAAAEAAMYQAAVQERIANRQADLQQYSLGISRDQLRMMMEENDYNRRLEQNNRSQLQQERSWEKGEYEKYKQQLSVEQQYMMDRQVAADRAAAQQRALALEEYTKNRNLAANEREYALAELKNAQAIAKGEHDEDLQRYYLNQQRLQGERGYAQSMYDKMNERLVSERGVEMDRRNKITGRLEEYQRALEKTYSELGDLPTVRRFTEQDIAAEEARRATRNMADVDRAAEKVASINEANLIRGGIDSGTAGAKKRAEITEQIAYLYDQARSRARDDALAYINGTQGVLNTGFDKEVARRGVALNEVGNVSSAGIEQLMNLPGLPSAVDYNFFNIPSAGYDRQVVSANNYQSPLAVNSAIYDNLNVPVGMANSIGIPSSAATNWGSIKSGIMGAYPQQFANPQGYMSIAANIGSDLLSNATSMYQSAQQRADLASAAAGASFQNLISSAGGFFDSFQSPSQQPKPYYMPTNINQFYNMHRGGFNPQTGMFGSI